MAEHLEAMLLDNEDITARALARRMDGILKHASDITRQPERRTKLEEYQGRQAELRSVMEKANKQSKSNLCKAIERKDREIENLTRQRDLLIASHRAMILAVGEMKGMKAWLRFFQHYQEAIDEIHAMGGLPENVTSLCDTDEAG